MPEWEFETLDSHLKAGDIFASRGDVISKIDIEKTPGKYPIYSSSAQKNGKFGEYGKYMFDEELITWSVDGGGNFFHRQKHKFSVTNVCGYLRVINKDIDPLFLFYSLDDQHSRLNFDYQSKAHPSVIRKLYKIPKIDKLVQLKIAQIIKALDTQIEQTEALIAKQENIRQGLMQDLFTRGVDETGQLRPAYQDAPHLYHETELGWLPLGWKVCSVIDYCTDGRQPILTGPFGADLGRDDFIADGVPLLRIGNVQDGFINLDNLLFISSKKANQLERYKVRNSDLLFARQGATTGRNSLANDKVDGAVINYHIIRLSLDPKKCSPRVVETVFRSAAILRQIDVLKGRSTREGINTQQIISLRLPKPEEEEHFAIGRIFENHIQATDGLKNELKKLQKQKSGLMRDLLSGEVSVAPLMQDASA